MLLRVDGKTGVNAVKLLVTGGAGFIGSNFIRWVLTEDTDAQVLNLEKLTYSGKFVNFAAETHVDRSIQCAQPFLHTNYLGTHSLIEAARRQGVQRFIQISTDEVYGSADERRYFSETALLRPSNPYAASKAAADLLVLSYVNTYKFPALVL